MKLAPRYLQSLESSKALVAIFFCDSRSTELVFKPSLTDEGIIAATSTFLSQLSASSAIRPGLVALNLGASPLLLKSDLNDWLRVYGIRSGVGFLDVAIPDPRFLLRVATDLSLTEWIESKLKKASSINWTNRNNRFITSESDWRSTLDTADIDSCAAFKGLADLVVVERAESTRGPISFYQRFFECALQSQFYLRSPNTTTPMLMELAMMAGCIPIDFGVLPRTHAFWEIRCNQGWQPKIHLGKFSAAAFFEKNIGPNAKQLSDYSEKIRSWSNDFFSAKALFKHLSFIVARAQAEGVAVPSSVLDAGHTRSSQQSRTTRSFITSEINVGQRGLRQALEFHKAGNHRDAEIIYKEISNTDPLNSLARYNLAALYAQQERFDEALEVLGSIRSVEGLFAKSASLRGYCLYGLEDVEEAIRELLDAASVKPFAPGILTNLGNAFLLGNRLDEALMSYSAALALTGDREEALNGRSEVFLRLRKLEQAKGDLEEAIKINPNRVSTAYSLATTLLNLGEEEQGWRLYESRLNLKRAKLTATKSPRWKGESLKGKTILVLAEQGYGDMIQFIRYVYPLLDLGGTVLVECPEVLRRLFQTIPKIRVVGMRESHSADFHVPLMSLPLELKSWTRSHDVPAQYFSVDETTIEKWRRRLEPQRADGTRQIGIAWAGASRDSHPHAKRLDKRRSLPMSVALDFVRSTNATFHSLQINSLEELAAAAYPLSSPSSILPRNLIDHSTKLISFYETAALIKNLDEVITVDTAVVHLAGALGVKTRLINRFDHCWRWGKINERTPWYRNLVSASLSECANIYR